MSEDYSILEVSLDYSPSELEAGQIEEAYNEILNSEEYREQGLGVTQSSPRINDSVIFDVVAGDPLEPVNYEAQQEAAEEVVNAVEEIIGEDLDPELERTGAS